MPEAYFRLDRVDALLDAFRGLERASARVEERLDSLVQSGDERGRRLLAELRRIPSAAAATTAASGSVEARDGAGAAMVAGPLLFDQTLASLIRLPPRRDAGSAWGMHVPFAHWIMRAAEPEVLVELGTYSGVSYAAFCQAVVDAGLPTRCHAVDTWRGDRHAGEYGDDVFEDLRRYHDPRYGNFSTLHRMTFDEALAWFSDGVVDLLHIDGLHTFEAVKHDFEAWRAKLSARGVVLFHDINVRWEDFGVWRLWDELRGRYPSFEFHFGYGLGVLAVGEDSPPAVRALCGLSDPREIAAFRNRFLQLAEHWRRIDELTNRAEALGDARAEVERLRQERDAHARAAEDGRREVGELRETIVRLEAAAAERVATTTGELARLRAEAAELRAAAAAPAVPPMAAK